MVTERDGLVVADPDTGEKLLAPREVAALLRVNPKTVTRWAKAGYIDAVRLPSGHRRYRESEIRALLNGAPTQKEPDAYPHA